MKPLTQIGVAAASSSLVSLLAAYPVGAATFQWSYQFSDGRKVAGRVDGQLNANILLNPTNLKADYLDIDGSTLLFSYLNADFRAFIAVGGAEEQVFTVNGEGVSLGAYRIDELGTGTQEASLILRESDNPAAFSLVEGLEGSFDLSFERTRWRFAAIPEPLTFGGSLLALGWGILFKKKAQKRQRRQP